MMFTPWYMPPGNAPLPCAQRSRNTSMECLGVITHVDEPTDWVSSITYIQKANGKLGMCLDPHDLNEAICQDHHKMPTMEEVAHEFVHSCYFTKLSLTRSPTCLWHSTVPLEDTISCDFPLAWSVPKTSSRRRWTRSSNPQRVSWMHWNCRWHHCPWLPEAEHDARLQNLMSIACKYNLVFNSQKHMWRLRPSIPLAASKIPNADGVHPHPGKVDMLYMPYQHQQTSPNSKSS